MAPPGGGDGGRAAAGLGGLLDPRAVRGDGEQELRLLGRRTEGREEEELELAGGEEEEDAYQVGLATPMGEDVVVPAAGAEAAAADDGEPLDLVQADRPPPGHVRRRGSGGSGSGGSGVLRGLVRLLPMSLMPRTSLRYKRHLSCTDIDAFKLQDEEGTLALDDDLRFGRRGNALLHLHDQQHQQQQRIEEVATPTSSGSSKAQAQEEEGEGAAAIAAKSGPPASTPSLLGSPLDSSSSPRSPPSTATQSSPSLRPVAAASSSPGSPSRRPKRGTRIRRCASMPAAPVSAPPRELVVNFPGGGKFFYWQSGVATFLNRHFDLQHAKLVGASAGSLTATLMACNVDAHHATEVAVRILREYNVWDRPMGLVGVWGGVVRDWLMEILPPNAAELCSGRVHISVLCLPYRRHHVSEFASKEDLIDTCMASAHLPMVMDGKPFFMWRGWPCVDGSIMANRRDVPAHLADAEHVTFDYVEDELLAETRASKGEFMALSDPAGLKGLVEMGYKFAERLTTSGLLPSTIQTLRKFDVAGQEQEDAEGDDASSPASPASSSSASAVSSPASDTTTVSSSNDSLPLPLPVPLAGVPAALLAAMAQAQNNRATKRTGSQISLEEMLEDGSRQPSVAASVSDVESPLSSPSSVSSADGGGIGDEDHHSHHHSHRGGGLGLSSSGSRRR